MNTRKLGLLLTSGILVSCAYNKMYVNQLTDPEWEYDGGAIEVWKPSNNNLDDKNVRAIVKKNLMKRFSVSDSAPEYFLFWSRWNTEGTGQSTLFLPQSQTTSGNFGGIQYSQTTSSGLQAIPYTYSYNFKKIEFELYKRNDIDKYIADTSFKPQMVWSGFCSIDNKLLPEYEQPFYDSCLVGFARRRQGEIQFIPNRSSPVGSTKPSKSSGYGF